MSEKMPSSAPFEAAETRGELSDERKQSLGRRIIGVFTALHEKFSGQPKMSDEERLLAKEKARTDEEIAEQTGRRDKTVEILQDPDLSEADRRSAGIDLEYRSKRIMNLQMRRIGNALPEPLSSIAIESLDPDRHQELTFGFSTGRVDKIMPTMVEIADGKATPEDLRKALGDLSGPVTKERLSEVRLFLRAEPFAKALTGDSSDFPEIGARTLRSAAAERYDFTYRDRLQGRLDSEELSDLERAAIQAEIDDTTERIERVTARKERELEEYQRAHATVRKQPPVERPVPEPLAEPMPEPAPIAEAEPILEPDFPLGPVHPQQEEDQFDIQQDTEAKIQHQIRRDLRREMEAHTDPDMLDKVNESLLEAYTRQVADLEQQTAEKGAIITPEDIAYLEKRRAVLARSQIAFIAHRLPEDMRESFMEDTDFDSDPRKHDEKFVLPILVEAARGHFDADGLEEYFANVAGNIPEERRSQILQSYRVYLQALLDRNQ